MGIVHGLEVETGVIAVEVAVLNQVFDSIDHLRPLEAGLRYSSLHELTFLKRLAWVKRASSTTKRLVHAFRCEWAMHTCEV